MEIRWPSCGPDCAMDQGEGRFAEATARAIVDSVGRLRDAELAKPPGVAESVEWAEAVTLLHSQGTPWPAAFRQAIGVALKNRDDLASMEPRLDAVLPREAA